MPAVPSSMLVSHVAGSVLGSIEIHAELSTSLDFYAGYDKPVCWDTLHVRRPHRWTGELMPDWRHLLSLLPTDSIHLIHVHPSAGEIALLGGNRRGGCGLKDMLKILRDKAPNAPAIVEAAPRPYLTPGDTAMFAKHLREAVSRYLD